MHRHQPLWLEVRGSEALSEIGGAALPRVDPSEVDVRRMVEGFRLGVRDLAPIWEHVLAPETLAEVLSLETADAASFRFPDELWARVGVGYEIVPRLALSAEYFGMLPLQNGAHERMEVLGAVRYSPDRAEDVTLELGGGPGLSDSAGSPAFRAIAAACGRASTTPSAFG